MTGTAIQVKINRAAREMSTSRILGKLFFNVKSLNFRLINGMFETIRKESNKVNPYKNHLFNNRSITHCWLTFQYISGKEATNIPTAGTGNPLNEKDWLLSRVNLAKRHAAAQGKSNER